jgi:hypothetical protein
MDDDKQLLIKSRPGPIVTAKAFGWTQLQFDAAYHGAFVTRELGGVYREVWVPEKGVWVRDTEFVGSYPR